MRLGLIPCLLALVVTIGAACGTSSTPGPTPKLRSTPTNALTLTPEPTSTHTPVSSPTRAVTPEPTTAQLQDEDGVSQPKVSEPQSEITTDTSDWKSDRNKSWNTFEDQQNGYELKYPTQQNGINCGRGKYGAPYDEQFGCRTGFSGGSIKFLMLPWKNTKGYFELNVDRAFLQLEPIDLLNGIKNEYTKLGFSPLSTVSIEDTQVIRQFKEDESAKTTNPKTGEVWRQLRYREVWYILHEDLLLEARMTLRGPDDEFERLKTQLAIFENIMETLTFE